MGKGLTFDSGGYNLKVGGMIEMMKFDMGGGGAVLGAAQIIAALKPPGVTVSHLQSASRVQHAPQLPYHACTICHMNSTHGAAPMLQHDQQGSEKRLRADPLHLSCLREHGGRKRHAAWRHLDQRQREDS